MKRYGVTITFSQSAYVEVEAEDEQMAEELAYEQVDQGNAEPYGDEWDEAEVEEIGSE